MKRLVTLLVTLIAALCVMVAPAYADDPDDANIPDFIGETACYAVGGGLIGPLVGEGDLCEEAGEAAEKVVSKEWWDGVWDSVLGDVIKSSKDTTKWLLKKMFTLALEGPSLDLEATGLFGSEEDVTLAGALVWLGWVIAAFGLMWQLGKMAVTGQMKYAGQALVGWVQNALLTGIGLTIVVALLRLGDEMTEGLVEVAFGNSGAAYKRLVNVLLPAAIANPTTTLGVVAVLLLVGFLQMIMIFLRQAAIPIQCLLLPIAGAGRVGGEATRQWAPRLITSILVVIAYKPILAIIICTGFAEFGKAHTLAEWLRGVATLVLGVLAPGPLTKLFAPIGAEVGAGLSAGGAIAAADNLGSLVGRFRGSGGGGTKGSDGGAELPNPVDRARQVEQTMPKSYQSDQGGEDTNGGDAVPQAARNEASVKAPSPTVPMGADQTGGTGGAEVGAGTGGVGTGTTGVANPAALGIQVLDGLNDGVQRGAREIGDGGNKL